MADVTGMKPTLIRCLTLTVAMLFLLRGDARAGLIELFEHETEGLVVLSIEGNRLRLTDVAEGTEPMQVLTNPGSGATTAENIGIAGDWSEQTVLSVILQDSSLLPTTRLDSLLSGTGLSTSGNTLKDLVVFTSTVRAFAIDLDSVEVIGGPVPEPGTLCITAVGAACVLMRRIGFTRLLLNM